MRKEIATMASNVGTTERHHYKIYPTQEETFLTFYIEDYRPQYFTVMILDNSADRFSETPVFHIKNVWPDISIAALISITSDIKQAWLSWIYDFETSSTITSLFDLPFTEELMREYVRNVQMEKVVL